MTHTIKTGFVKTMSLMFTVALMLGMISIPANAATAGITLSGTCHVQDYGDTNGVWDASTGTLTLGTRGQAKRVEAITINLENTTGIEGSLQYRVHVQDIGWQDYRSAGEMAGTSGQAKRLEGIEMELTGDLAAYYTVEYAVHIQDYGDAQGFVSDGALAGTTGESKRLEEVQVRIVPRGQGTSTTVNYRVHRQDYGWESSWAKNGAESGTTGQAKRLEGIEIHLTGNQFSGSIEYRTHVQNIGWESEWSKDGEMSGTQGLSYRLEGIEIKLTGDIANYYDVYYRVHAQDYGWLGWAKNGEMSGTSGMSKRLEAIQIVLVAKGGAAPGNVAGISSVMSAPAVVYGSPTNPSVEKPAEQTIFKTGVDVRIHFEYCIDFEQGICKELTLVVHNVDPDVWWPASDTHAKKALIAEYGLDPDLLAGIGSKSIIGAYYSDGSYYSYSLSQPTDAPAQRYITGVDVAIAFRYITDAGSGASESMYLVVHNVDPHPYPNWSSNDNKAEEALVSEYGFDPDMICDISNKDVIGAYFSDGSYYSFTKDQLTVPPTLSKDTEGHTVPCNHEWIRLKEYEDSWGCEYMCTVCGVVEYFSKSKAPV